MQIRKVDAVPEPPTFATHYYVDGRKPFRSLSDLDDAHREVVLADLRATRDVTGSQRIFGPRYMAMRRITEERPRVLFREKIGEPERHNPHSFVLGASSWLRGLARTTREITLPLSAFPPDQTSVTYPDSFEAMGSGPDFGLPREPRPYHGQVCCLDEIPRLLEQWSLPRWLTES